MSETGSAGQADPSTNFGLDDNALAAHSTVFAEGCLGGETVLVSGGAGGLGRATAWLMGRLGARVVLAGRDAAKLAEAAEAMRTRGIDTSYHALDIREPEAVQAPQAVDDGPPDDAKVALIKPWCERLSN